MSIYHFLTTNFWSLLIIAFVLKETPYLGIPFNWLESFFHEFSHGLAAIVTGGKILQIELFPNGAGLCTTQGGIAFIIAFSGYAGAVVWGVLIYKIAEFKSSISRYFSLFIVLLLALSCVLWVRDLLTLVIILILIAMFTLSIKISHFNFLPVILKLVALMVLLNSLSSPLYLIDGRGIGDGSALAELTFIPEIIWILIWSAIGVYSIFRLSKNKK